MTRALKMLALVVLVVVPLLVSLGFWQLQRAGEKRELLAAQEAQRALPPRPLAELGGTDLPQFRAVIVRGEYDRERYWLLENRIVDGRYGYELVSPFILLSGDTLLVHRGWLPGDASRRQWPDIATPAGVLTLTGRVDHGFGEGFELAGAQVQNGWPRRVQWLPRERAEQALGTALPGFVLRLRAGEPGMHTQNYQSVNMSPQKHIGYAVQWFGMAIIVGLIFVVQLWRQWRVRQEDRT